MNREYCRDKISPILDIVAHALDSVAGDCRIIVSDSVAAAEVMQDIDQDAQEFVLVGGKRWITE
jgi:hypothetical protein